MFPFITTAVFVVLLRISSAVRIDEVTGKCRSECGISLLTQTGEVSDFHCNDTCRITQCSLGCQHWQEAIKDDNCWDVCSKRNNFSSDNSIMHLCCVMGCRFAGSLYIQNVKDEIGIPPSPVLVADSQTNTSVRVCWDAASLSLVPLNVSYRLQWKYESLNGGWEYYRPKVPIVETIQQINGLQPYTKYRFRVAWIILPQHNPLISSESVVISTLAYGAPSTPPIITSITHIDTTRVSVTWEPPSFPNGPVLSYVAHLAQLPTGFTVIKDIPEPKAENFFIFNNLKPNTTYSVAVSCRNNVGEGPKEMRNVTMPAKPQMNDTSIAYLILGARQKVFKQSRDMVNNPQVLYQTDNDTVTVEGIAIHVQKKLLFLSDSTGAIHRVPIHHRGGNLRDHFASNVTPANMNGSPKSLSVDWLNDKLYTVEGSRISRCDLNGSNYEVVVTGLECTPTDMKVDPYNGYLYWVQYDSPSGGLFQVDLKDLEEGKAMEDSSKVRLLVADSHLTAFTVDHQNFRLFFPNETGNTIYATSLNGLEIANVRQNTQKSRFRGVKSITYFRDLFYFMTKDELIGEEYHEEKYYHNSFLYLSAEKPFVGLEMLHSDAQPIPVPINQPRDLQAVCKETMAKLQWLAPLPLTVLGRGSWQRWLYEISIEDHSKNATVVLRDVVDATHTLVGLTENTEYSIKVRACSKGGKGPWSDVFRGRTLKLATRQGFPFVLWSAGEGILKSDIIGDNIEPLIHQTNLQHAHVIDISWHNDLLFLNTNASHVYVYNTSNHFSLKMLTEVTSAVSISVDWLGRKLYWSNPKQQMISRSNFDGSQVESLLILTIAKELNVDAFNGFIYWTTMHSVECARLNGDDRRTYYQTGNYFSGKQVMGLTLDNDHQRVYWLVWSFNGARLYHARMASYHDRTSGTDSLRANVEEFSPPLEYTIADRQGVLRYYSNHLYWLQNQSQALISDIYQQNVARLHALDLDDLKTLIVIDPTLQPCPEGFTPDNITVIPNAVNETTLRVNGKWSGFNVTWAPITNVNYGKVYYEIVVDDQTSNNTLVWEHAYYIYPAAASLGPYSPLAISIRAFTYWGFSRRITKALRSPMSVPSEPLNPRVFVAYERSPHRASSHPNVHAEFRWLPPKRPNGIVLGYVVTCWNAAPDGRRNIDPIWEEDVSGDEKPVYFAKFFAPDVSYFFQVRAYTEAGEGPASAIVEAKAGVEIPIPRLLLARNDGVDVADVDTREEERLPTESTHPVDIAYIWETKSIFWLDQGATLMRSNMDGTNKTKLRELSATGRSLSIDWLGRHLYWSEVDQTLKSSTIWTMDLSRTKDGPEIVIKSFGEIGSIKVDPFSSKILWTSVYEDGFGCLMSSKTDGAGIRPLFPVVRRCFASASASESEKDLGKRLGKRESDDPPRQAEGGGETAAKDEEDATDGDLAGEDLLHHNVSSDYEDLLFFMADQSPSSSPSSCNCPRDVVVGSAMTTDLSNGTKPELVWIDVRRGNLWTSDLKGCQCRLLVNGTLMPDNGLPPTSITVDSTHVYWSNASTGHIYSVPKSPELLDADDPRASGRSKASDQMPLKSEAVKGIRGIVALGSHLQPYPDIKCLAPQSYNESAHIENVSSTSVTLLLKPVRQLPDCGDISLASVSYVVLYSTPTDEPTAQYWTAKEDACGDCVGSCVGTGNATMPNSCRSLVTFNTTVNLAGLRPYNGYSVRVAASNLYSTTPVGPGPRVLVRTAEGVPSKPRNVRVQVLTPEKVDVTWDAPLVIYGPSVRYYVQWKGHFPATSDRQTFSDSFRQVFEPARDGAYNVSLPGLQPGQNYSIMVRAHPMTGDAFNSSEEVFVRTFDVPDNLTLNSLSSTAISLSWRSPNDSSIAQHSLMYKEFFGNLTAESEPRTTRSNVVYSFNITDLSPNMRYVFRLKVVYNSSAMASYVWPAGKENGFHFETKGDRPSPPGSPEVISIQRDTYKVTWKPSDGRGGKDVRYFLQVQSRDDEPSETAIVDWKQVYNGSESKWVAAGLNPDDRYAFRVYAANEFGVGNFSEESAAIILSQIPVFGDKEGELAFVLGITVPIIFIFLSVSLYILCTVYKKREKDKKMLQEMAMNLRGPDLELNTLRELPHHPSFVHQNNALYSLGDVISDEELASLPHIGKEQLILGEALGSGAFGEVYEGLVWNLPGTNNGEAVPVAIKTLRKGATDQEKSEFLKEAKLMGNFKHEHILHLLGVCLNSNPNFIILELMEGGDLLSYLRSNRPTMFSTPSLTIQDLISICVDVARGCRYLEELRFVHRDLAARNCLVSSYDSSKRVVKIGDFGLARDVYKSDYYRKEGEGLLPVRWMSPESLVDGVFTSHSDVWAFGVLLWEIMTLGAHPYPARSNLEVLSYVRGGGHLDKPANSPDDLHRLMLRCWSYNPHDRPTFKYCLEQLQELRRKSAELPLTAVHNRNYLGRSDGVDNPAYDAEEACPCSPGDKVDEGRRKQNPRTPRNNSSVLHNAGMEGGDGHVYDMQNGESRHTRRSDGCARRTPDFDDRAELLDPDGPTEAHKYLELLYDSDTPPTYESDGYEIPLSPADKQKDPPGALGEAPRSGTVLRSGADPAANGNATARHADLESCSDDAKSAGAGLDCHGQPLLLRKQLSRSRGSVASAGDADVRAAAGARQARNLKPISDSAPLLQNANNPYANVKRLPTGTGRIGFSTQQSWKDSSLSLGSASDCSSPASPSPLSGDVLSGMSALSALSGLASSSSNSSSTSGIEADYAPTPQLLLRAWRSHC